MKELTVKIVLNDRQYSLLESIHEDTKKRFSNLTIEDELSRLTQYLVNRDLVKEMELEKEAIASVGTSDPEEEEPLTVEDYIRNNDNIRIRIAQKYSRDKYDPLTSTLWEGMLYDVPEDLRGLEVLNEGWMMDAQINQLEVFSGRR